MKWILLFKRNEMEILQNFQGLLEKVSTEKKLNKKRKEGKELRVFQSNILILKNCSESFVGLTIMVNPV